MLKTGMASEAAVAVSEDGSPSPRADNRSKNTGLETRHYKERERDSTPHAMG